ncbi:unnamed protein product [Cylicostephanus goldi]|uniref:Uncharacterized protein n=1 Tax=Cylicostephanus goldi TaxID=71465 RepID=A0A3P6RGI5_CYLGO|nr:unnamed protein product [Cylicostephanus goldi]
MVPESIYPYPEFPKYCSSGTYTLCGKYLFNIFGISVIVQVMMFLVNCLQSLVKVGFLIQPTIGLKLPEDVLFTGIFAEIAGIRRTHIGGMSFIDAPDYICRNGLRTYSLHMNRVRNPSNYFKRLTAMEGHPC